MVSPSPHGILCSSISYYRRYSSPCLGPPYWPSILITLLLWALTAEGPKPATLSKTHLTGTKKAAIVNDDGYRLWNPAPLVSRKGKFCGATYVPESSLHGSGQGYAWAKSYSCLGLSSSQSCFTLSLISFSSTTYPQKITCMHILVSSYHFQEAQIGSYLTKSLVL